MRGRLLHIPTGCYELKAINAEMTRIRGNSDITILPNVNTLQCILTMVGAKGKVSFDVQYKVNVSENQVNTLKDDIRLKKGVTLCFSRGGIRGDHVLLLTPAQIN